MTREEHLLSDLKKNYMERLESALNMKKDKRSRIFTLLTHDALTLSKLKDLINDSNGVRELDKLFENSLHHDGDKISPRLITIIKELPYNNDENELYNYVKGYNKNNINLSKVDMPILYKFLITFLEINMGG